MKVACFDVGVTHLALVCAEVVRTEKVCIHAYHHVCADITVFPHKKVPRCDCQLQHTNTITDWMSHFFQEHATEVEDCECVLIERQPITGLVSVEQSIFCKYRSKAILIHPKSMHKFLSISECTYDQRKEKVENLLQNKVEQGVWAMDNFEGWKALSRKHDIADAVALIYFWFCKQTQNTPHKCAKLDTSTFDNLMHRSKYVKHKPNEPQKPNKMH